MMLTTYYPLLGARSLGTLTARSREDALVQAWLLWGRRDVDVIAESARYEDKAVALDVQRRADAMEPHP
jgi:hypothetical protein